MVTLEARVPGRALVRVHKGEVDYERERSHHVTTGMAVQAEAYRSNARNEQPERRGRHGVKVLAGYTLCS